MKKFLAFDSASEELRVAAFNGKKYYEMREVASGTENLMVLIDKVLRKAKMTLQDVEVLAVGVGPGSWTGSRVAVVSALGLVSGNPDLKVSIFNSFDLISYNKADVVKVVKLVKAYANFVYVQFEDGSIQAITKDELNAYTGCEFIGLTKVVETTKVVELDFESCMKDLIQKEIFVLPDQIEPMYLRLSQAEYQRMEKLKNDR